MKKKYLIIGGSGFIGSSILERLNKSKLKVEATYFKNKNFIPIKKVKYFKGDLRNFNYCKKITKMVDTVIMCAAVSSGSMIIQNNPMYHVDDNVLMNLNVLKACAKNKVKKFVFISSNTVYPVSKKSMREKDVNYSLFHKYFNVGWMKIFSEKLCEMYKDKMSILIIRPGNIYGPNDKFDPIRSKVIPALIRKFEENKIIEIWGDGQDIKDFIYIDDFVKALLKLTAELNGFNVINLASGKSIKLKKIINFLKKTYNIKNNEIRYNTSKPTMVPFRKISVKKIKSLINFKVNTSIEKGILKTIKWYKENIKNYEERRSKRY